MNKIRLTIAGAIVFFCVVVNHSYAQNLENSLIGKWYVIGSSGHETSIYEFSANKWRYVDAGIMVEHDYVIVGNKLFIQNEHTFDFEIQNNDTLIIIYTHNYFEICERLSDNVNSLNGMYFLADVHITDANDVELVSSLGLFQSIEFVDDKYLKMVGGLFGYNTIVAGEYEISGTSLIIKARGEIIILEILGDTFLRCSTGSRNLLYFLGKK